MNHPFVSVPEGLAPSASADNGGAGNHVLACVNGGWFIRSWGFSTGASSANIPRAFVLQQQEIQHKATFQTEQK